MTFPNQGFIKPTRVFMYTLSPNQKINKLGDKKPNIYIR